MIPLVIKNLCEIVDGIPYAISDLNQTVNLITTDSRESQEKSVFCALVGDNFDGHTFAKQSIQNGAIAVMVNKKLADDSPQLDDIPKIIVQDTRQALGKIASYVRAQVPTKMVALTGSSGKTTVKEMAAAILKNGGQTLYTQGNFNNDIGVPLTLLRLTPHDQFAVIELGANHLGEIAYTTQLVKPKAVLINNISEAHIEGFKSLEGVAKAKGEIFQGLSSDGQAIINLESYSEKWLAQLEKQRVWTFSLKNTKADFYASEIKQEANMTTFILHTPQGECPIQLPLTGQHNVSNGIAAAALTLSVGASFSDIVQGLLHLQPVKGRLFPIKLNDNQIIWDDTYNANVGSMTAAIDVLTNQPGYKVLVVGDMAELGPDSEKFHQQIGELAGQTNIDCVVSVGKQSKLISKFSQMGYHFTSKKDAVKCLLDLLCQHDKLTMLVKGSRSAKMEEIIDGIKNDKLKINQG